MLAALALAALSQAPTEWLVKPGDTCASIAKAVWGDARAYDRLHAANGMGPPPHTLVVGQRLILAMPDAGPQSTRAAELSFVKPAVEARHADAGWAAGEQGQPLFRLDEVNTQARAAAVITFDDSSALRMRENAFVVVLGPPVEPARVTRAPGLELRQGEATLSLAALKGLPIVTPGAQLVAQGKAVWLDVDPSSATRLAAHAGSATVSAQGQRVRVANGHGTRVKPGEPPEPPTRLPPPPMWSSEPLIATGPLVDGGVDVLLTWDMPPRAATARVEVASQPSFDAIDQLGTGPGGATLLLAPGAYVARLASVDGRGLVGRYAPIRSMYVVEVPATAVAPWHLRAPLSPKLDVTIDGQSPNEMVLTPGRHLVQIRHQSTTRAVEVMVVLPSLQISIEHRQAVISGPLVALQHPALSLVDGNGKSWPLTVQPTEARSNDLPDGAYSLRWLSYALATTEVPSPKRLQNH